MHRIKTLLTAATLVMALSAPPAQAVIFQFYEGNNCTQKKLGAADVQNMSSDVWSWNMKRVGEDLRRVALVFMPFIGPLMTDTYNDEIRSVLVLSNWRTMREARNPTFSVYDDPDGKTKDDWAKLYVSDATLIPEEGVCVGSFEKSFNRHGIRLERHPDNGLDGKISHLKIGCDATCRGNLTPDQTPVATAVQPLEQPKPKLVVTHREPGRTMSKEAADALKARKTGEKPKPKLKFKPLQRTLPER